MSSQFFGLNISYTGLLASNAGLNTTSNNIANVQTRGYSRQTVSQSASTALRTFQTYGCAGAGVDVLAIERVRDEFYDVKYWNNNSDYGQYDVKSYYMSQFERYFADNDDIEGFTTIFNKMYDAMAEIKKQAGDIPSKTQFVGFAKSLTEYFNDMAGNLEKMQKDMNDEIKNKVDNINSLATEIASLNKQINVVEMGGSVANELRDQRTVLVDKLSKVVDVEVKETPIYDPNYPDRFTGAYDFSVKICGGQTLVDTGEYNTLECVAREKGNKVNQSDIEGLYDIQWSNGLEVNLHGKNLGGELKALVEMRDGNNGENFNGTVSSVDKDGRIIDGTAYDTVTIDVTEDYMKDLNKSVLSDTGGEIALGNQVFKYDSWSAKKNDDGTYSYTFTLSKDNENTISGDRIGKEAEVGTAVNYQGVPYYQEQLNEFVRIFAAKFNEILTQENAVDSYGNPAVYLFVADHQMDDGQSFFVDQPSDMDAAWEIDSSDDTYYQLTAKNFTINDAIVDSPGKFATYTKNGEDGDTETVDKYNILDELTDMKTNTKVLKFRNSSASEFLQCITSDVSLNANRANTFCENFQNLEQSIDVMRTSISGVDEDEEAVNLTKYQNAYNLASRMIQTFTEIYDRLILSTGV